MLFVSLLLLGCNNPSEKQLELELAQSTLEKNITMYETVWNKVINDREIDLINEDSFDKDVAALATSGGDIIGLENFKNYYNNYLTGFSDAEFTIVDILVKEIKWLNIGILKALTTEIFLGFLQQENL